MPYGIFAEDKQGRAYILAWNGERNRLIGEKDGDYSLHRMIFASATRMPVKFTYKDDARDFMKGMVQSRYQYMRVARLKKGGF